MPSVCPTKLGITNAGVCEGLVTRRLETGNGDSTRVRRWILRQHLVGIHARHLQVGDGPDVESAPSNIQIRCAPLSPKTSGIATRCGRDSVRLRTCQPLLHFHPGRRDLGDDFAFRHVHAVVLSLDGKGKTGSRDRFRRFPGAIPVTWGTATSLP